MIADGATERMGERAELSMVRRRIPGQVRKD
jgi:hypothetical protein